MSVVLGTPFRLSNLSYTLPILTCLCLQAWKRAPWLARIAFLWALIYPTFGMIQRDRAEAVGWQLAQERQHTPIRLGAKPSLRIS